MALNAGEVVYKIFGDNAEFKKSIGQLGSVAAKSLAGIGTAVTAASAAIAKVSEEAVKAYANYEQLVGGVETLFGASGMSIEEYAASVGKTVDKVKDEYDSLMNAQETVLGNASQAFRTAGMSANEYMETVTGFSAALIDSMGHDTEAAAKKADMAITDMADNANKMGSSLESIQNAYQGFAKQNYTMLDNLKLGYGGTKEEMERLLARAEELSGFKYDISSYADIVDAIHVVQDEMGITGTTAKEASETITGSIQMMKAAWENALTGMADPEQDFEALINDLVESVMIVEQNLAPRIEALLPQLASGIEQLASEILPQIPEIINGLLPEVLDGANELIGAILDTLGSIAETGGPVVAENAKAIISTLVNGISENLPDLITAAADMVIAIAEAILDGDNIRVLSQAAVDILMTLVNSISENVDELIPAAVGAVMAFAETLLSAENILQILHAAQELIRALSSALLNALPELLGKVPVIVSEILSALVEAIPDTIEFAVRLCTEIAGTILGYDWESVGSEVYHRINDGQKEAEDEVSKERIQRYSNKTASEIRAMMANVQSQKDEVNKAWADWIENGNFDDIPMWMRKSMEATGKSFEMFVSDFNNESAQTLSDLTDALVYATEDVEEAVDGLPAAFDNSDAEEKAKEHYSKVSKAASKGGEEVVETIKKLTDDEAKALRNQAKIDLADGLISEDEYYNRLEGIKDALSEESKLYDSYALEIANGRKKLRDASQKQATADKKQAEADRKQAERDLRESVENKFRDLETEQLTKEYDDSWLMEQKRAFIETLDHNSDVYKDYNLKLLQEQEKTDKQAEKEADQTAKKQISSLKSAYQSLIRARDSMADKLSLSADIFQTSEETDKRTGGKVKSRKSVIDDLEKKLRAKKQLSAKIAELYEKNVSNDIVQALLKKDPEDALADANELLRDSKTFNRLNSIMKTDEGLSRDIANMVTEHSEEYDKLGADAGDLFGESFADSVMAQWDKAFEKIFGDEDYLLKLAQNVSTANATAGTSSAASVQRNIVVEQPQTAQSAKAAPTTSGGSVSTIKLVDVNWNYVAKGVNAENMNIDRMGGR